MITCRFRAVNTCPGASNTGACNAATMATALSQAVCVRLDPALELGAVWQLLRYEPERRTGTYTVTASRAAARCGMILVAMDEAGAPRLCPTSRRPLCVAPSTSVDVTAQPLARSSVALAAFDANSPDPALRPFLWNVARFAEGGVAFHTTLSSAAQWLAARGAACSCPADGTSLHYLTDDARLLSERRTNGQLAGYSMSLAYPPVLDIGAALQEHEASDDNSVSAAALLRRALVDAAIDCGFFIAVATCGERTREAAGRVTRILRAVQHRFGSNLRRRPTLVAGATQEPDSVVGNDVFSPNAIRGGELDRKLTKLTLRSSTGLVKVNFNPIEYGVVKLPPWIHGDLTRLDVAQHIRSRHPELAVADDVAATTPNIEQDVVAHFDVAEGIACRLIGALLAGIDSDSSAVSVSECPTTTTRTSASALPTVPRHEVYSLLRAVCYPPTQHDSGASSASTAENGDHKALYEHTDKTWVTMLIAHPGFDGLQMIDVDGTSFVDVRLPSRLGQLHDAITFVCNVGDALQIVSGGAYVSRLHRARNTLVEPGASRGTTEPAERCPCQACRVSLPLFVEPTPERWPR